MRTLRVLQIVGGFCAILLMASATTTTLAKVKQGSGRPTKVDWVSSNDPASTNTGKYEDVPDMTRTFDTARNRNTVVIHYCANTFAQGSDIIHVRVRLDGKGVFPGGVQFNAENPTFNESNCFTWIAKRVPQGSHTVLVQHRSSGAGVQVFSNKRTLTIWHE